MKLSQLEKWIQQTLTNLKDIIQKGWNHLCRSGWTRSTRSQANEAWALYKSNPSWVSWGDLSRNWYITCPKVSLPGPCWKYNFSGATVHFGTSSLGLFGLYPSSLPKSAGFILGKLHWFLHLMLSYFYNPSMFIYCWSLNFVEKNCVGKGAGWLRCHLVPPTWYGGWIWGNYHEP